MIHAYSTLSTPSPKGATMLRLLFIALLGLLLPLPLLAQGSAPGAGPPTHTATADGRHTLNLKDADIQALIATVSEITGKNFIVGPNVQGKVTVVSARPMQSDEIYDVFLSVLRVHGFAAVPSGSMIKILPDAVAQQDAASAVDGTPARAADELVTEIVPVKHVSATELVPILRPLIPQYGHLAAYPASNMLIISDRANNVNRIVRIIRRIDQGGDAEIEVIPMQNASAAEVVRVVSQLVQGAPKAAPPRSTAQAAPAQPAAH